jgi:hypothetical protein
VFADPAFQCNCVPNALCLRNGTCYCPYFGDATSCSRERYQTLVKTTWSDVGKIALVSGPLLFTIDSTNYEAMKLLTDRFHNLGVWSASSRVVDSFDVHTPELEIVSMQVFDVNMTSDGQTLQIYVQYTLPTSDYFFFYVHLNDDQANAPCPPFSASCCAGDLGSSDYVTVGGIQCDDPNNKPIDRMTLWLAKFNGTALSPNMFMIPFNMSSLPQRSRSVVLPGGVNVTTDVIDYVVGIGMVTFGKFPQNTESRVAVQVSAQSSISVFGSFQYSFVKAATTQLEKYTTYSTRVTPTLFAHVVIEASHVEAVHGVRFRWDPINAPPPPPETPPASPFNFTFPACTGPAMQVCDGRFLGCNVSITPTYVEIWFPVVAPSDSFFDAGSTAFSLTVYTLLTRGSSISRVVTRTDASYTDRCPSPLQFSVSTVVPYKIQVLQQGQTMYMGAPQPITLTGTVILLTLRLHVDAAAADGRKFYISEVYILHSKDDPATILAPADSGNNTFALLSTRCVLADRCFVESLVYMGVSQDSTRCEITASGDIVLNPSFRWPGQGDYASPTINALVNVIMFVTVREKVTAISDAPAPSSARRLLRWLMRKT